MTNDMLQQFKELLVGAGLPSVVIGELPSRKIDVIAIQPVDGYASVYYFGKTSSYEPILEAQIRNKDYRTGQDWSETVKKTLDKYSNKAVGIDSCILTGSPGYLGSDENGFGEWHMLFHVTYFEGSGLNG